MHSKATRCSCPRIRFKYFIGQSFSGIRRLLICSVSSSLVLFIRAAAQPPGDVWAKGGGERLMLLLPLLLAEQQLPAEVAARWMAKAKRERGMRESGEQRKLQA